MDTIPQEVVIVGGVLLLGLVVVIVARYAKQILLFLLVAVGVAIIALIVWGWTQLQKPDLIPDDTAETISDVADIARALSTEDEPEPAPAEPVYSAPAPVFNCWDSFLTGVLVALLAGAVGVSGFCWARWKLAERGTPTKRKKRRPHRTQGQPIVYVIESPTDGIDWLGLEDVTEWTENDFFQL